MTAPSTAWFQRWFGEEYKRLYPHRDAAQAAAQVAAVRSAVARVAPECHVRNVLDIGCGTGRHLTAFSSPESSPSAPSAIPRIHGIDLSAVLLRDARAAGHAVARADMRRLPFADGRFDLVASFFTSFGYFADAAEDTATLREFARVVRPGGFLFLDLPNKSVVIRDLVPADEVVRSGRRVSVTRALEENVVVKRIRIECMVTDDVADDCSGENGGRGTGLVEPPRTEHHEERVRLYDLNEIAPALVAAGLEVAHILGDEHGAAYDPTLSPRMSLLLCRALRPATIAPTVASAHEGKRA